MSHRNRARGQRRRRVGIVPLVHAPVIVEVAANAPPEVVARVTAAVSAVRPSGAIELVRTAPQANPSDFRIRGPLLAWDAPIGAGAREWRAMECCFAAAYDGAALAAEGQPIPLTAALAAASAQLEQRRERDDPK